MLLWPRLDRSRLRRCGDDPIRIAEVVERRTAQPLAVILAMLTRQAAAPTPATEEAPGFESVRSTPVALHVIREPDSDLGELVLA